MEEELQNINRFERYLNGEMEGTELITFEKELQENEDLANELALFSDVLEGIEANGDEALERTLKGVESKLEKDNFFDQPSSSKIIKMNNSKSTWMRPLAIAASVAVLLGAGFYLMKPSDSQNSSSDMATVFAEYNQPDKAKIAKILDNLESSGFADENKNKADSLVQALSFYEKGEYKTAISSINEYLERYPEDNTAKLYLGLSLLQDEEYGKASKHLMPLAELEEFEHQDMAKWYLALCYTTFNSKTASEHAERLFKDLLNSTETEYAEGAKVFLQLL